jgi:hypothetical protein
MPFPAPVSAVARGVGAGVAADAVLALGDGDWAGAQAVAMMARLPRRANKDLGPDLRVIMMTGSS